jgi:hypothetical protein
MAPPSSDACAAMIEPDRPSIRWHAIPATALFAGAVMLLALGLLSIAVYEEPAFKILAMMAATVHGPSVLQAITEPDLRVLVTAFGVHFGLALGYATALAAILRDLPRWSAPWVGLAFGLAAYYANLHGFTLAFAWFEELRTFDTLVAHLAFGVLLARGVAPGEAREPAPRLAFSRP